MEPAEELEREIVTLRERLSRLTRASLRINETLEFETVLQGVLDSARALTDSRYGVMTLLDEAGRIQDFLASGMTPEQTRQLWELPDAMRFHEALSQIQQPLRVRDFLGHLRSLGLPEFRQPLPVDSVLSFLAAPVRHQGECVGHIFLAGKAGGREFLPEDEETLVMFTAQAALVISNARRYREEQRARTNLETLIDTSPVGVVVFDAKTGTPVSLNREVRRIVDDLRMPDQSPEQLLEVLTCRRADGREVSLEEFSMSQLLSFGETVRAEEIVLQVPDGRRVSALVNATPTRSDDGGMESFVVTLQDLKPLEDLERLRSEFLAMVSHEMRIPLAAIKGSAATVLSDTPGRSAAEMIQFFRIIDQQADQMSGLINDLLDVARIKTGTLQINPEPAAVTSLVELARDAFLGESGRSDIHIELAPSLPPVMADRRRIVQVLGNLLSNASRHSLETTPIRVTAVRDGLHVAVCVADQGAGVSAERLPHLFRKFARFDSEDRAGDDAGSGWGLAICRGIVEAHGGRIWAESEGVGLGTRVTFTIPIADEARIVIRPGSAETADSGRQKGKQRTPILVVDDDPLTLRNVRDALSTAGYLPFVTGNPDEVPRLMKEHSPRLIVLDLVLPGTDGVAVMTDIVGVADVPVIFLSAYGHEDAIARAFDAGADDYIVKPFSPTELAARIRAALRKRTAREQTVPDEPFVLGDLTIDYAGRKVTVAGRPMRLTNIEYRLLVELSVNAGRTVTYEDLLQRVWGKWDSDDTRTLRTAVKNIRRKLSDNAKNPTYIFNQPGDGYQMGMTE